LCQPKWLDSTFLVFKSAFTVEEDVAGKIVENVFGSTEGRLGVDDPVLGKEPPEEMLEAFGAASS
jgi:hypothetical protein